MSFHEAETADASLAGLADLLRDSLRDAAYLRNQDQIYENMDTDPLIGATGTPASRVDLLQHISAHRTDEARVKGETALFCRAHLQQGPLFPDAAATTFGRVTTFERTVKGIASDSALSLEQARALLRDAMGVPPATRLVRQRSDLGNKRLSPYQMWSFPVADPANLLAEIGATRQEAINILGLGDIQALDEVVAFAHRLPGGTAAHRPTAWDAGCFACWRPGGQTYRLDVEGYGLPEVVHDGITGDRLVSTIDLLA